MSLRKDLFVIAYLFLHFTTRQSMVASTHGQNGHNAVFPVEEEQDLDQGHAFNPHLRTVDEIAVNWVTKLGLGAAITTDAQV